MEEYDEIKDMKHQAIAIGTGVIVIVVGLYVLLHKEIKAVENRFVPLEEQTGVLSDSQKKNEEYKVAIQGCHKQAIKDAKKFWSNKYKSVQEVNPNNNDILKVTPVFDLDPSNQNKENKNDAVYYPDYEQYYTLCLREKGYVE